MELILSYRGKLHRLGLRHLILGLAMFTAVALVLQPGLNDSESVVADAQAMAAEDVDPQRVQRALIVAEAQMAELAARLGELQGRLTRLESIGQQVGELAGFDAEALGFDQPVPVGGPVTADDVTMELPQLLEEFASLRPVWMTGACDCNCLIRNCSPARPMPGVCQAADQPAVAGFLRRMVIVLIR